MGSVRPRVTVVLGVLLAVGLMAPAAASAHRPRHTPGLAQGKPWRQGIVPKRGIRAGALAGSANDLSYGGAIDNVGVVTGAPKVYLIFWGSQWGTQGTNASGNYTYSGDPTGVAPDLQAFFKGLGTDGETWSGVMTQYCQGVATGAQSCPSSNGQHVAYPNSPSGAYAGVWEDTSAAAPSEATAHQIAAEAIAAAEHFNSFSPNAQYFIVSPHGTYPDGFDTPSGQFCAWHDYTADSTMDGGGGVSSPAGDPPVAFTNMPYVTDAGASCGSNFVNGGSAGTLDGVTIVGGHEYAETLTDTFPAGGWTDASGNETADKCAWISSGQGAAQDISLGTGSFAVQSTWANDYNGGSGGCEVSHAIVSDPSSVTVSQPANQTTTVGRPASLQVTATDTNSGSTCCTWSASGLPTGWTISSSGVISGTAPTTAGSSNVTVTAKDSAGNSGTTTFTWTWAAGTATTVTGVSPSNVSLGVGGTQTFTASVVDQYNNPTSAAGVTWSTSAPGTLSPNGASATFTASGAGTGSVLAKLPDGSSASASVTVSAVANPITNGGFEEGGTGWTASGASGSENVVSAPGYPCYAGTYCAMLGLTTETNGNSNISQTFTASSGSSTVSFYYYVVCDDTVRYDWATATLKNSSSRRASTILPRTCNLNDRWVKVSAAVTPGQTYTLTLTNHDDNNPGDPTYTLFDNVSVQ